MVISKYLSGNTTLIINLANFTSNGVAQVWQLTAANTINRLADIGSSGNSFVVTLPPQSITLLVVAKNSNVPSPPNAPNSVTVTPD
jgi:O-glycosyl hydrolase